MTGVSRFFQDTQTAPVDPIRKSDCNGCGERKVEPYTDHDRISTEQILSYVTGRPTDYERPPSGGGYLPVKMQDHLHGQYIYWQGAPVTRITGSWKWSTGRLELSTPTDSKHVLIQNKPKWDHATGAAVIPRRRRQLSATVDAVLRHLPNHIGPHTVVGGFRCHHAQSHNLHMIKNDKQYAIFDDLFITLDNNRNVAEIEYVQADHDHKRPDAARLLLFIDHGKASRTAGRRSTP